MKKSVPISPAIQPEKNGQGKGSISENMRWRRSGVRRFREELWVASRRRNRVKKQMCFFFSLFVLISPITFSHVYSFFFRIVYIAFVRDTGCTVRFCLFTVGARWLRRVGCGALAGRCSPASVYF